MTVVECATLLVLVAVLQRRGAVYEALGAPALVLLGRLSYGVYLWHYPVVRYLRADLPWPAVVVLGLAVSLLLAALSYHTVERWGLRRRDALPRRRAGAIRTVAACAGLSLSVVPITLGTLE
jgi:peptidoglycan/LPS O-acetylase OafA/YrhL